MIREIFLRRVRNTEIMEENLSSFKNRQRSSEQIILGFCSFRGLVCIYIEKQERLKAYI